MTEKMPSNVVKLIETDQDDCKSHVEKLQAIIDDNNLTDIIWVGVDDNGDAYYGKLVYNKNRLTLVGALDLMKLNLLDYFRQEQD